MEEKFKPTVQRRQIWVTIGGGVNWGMEILRQFTHHSPVVARFVAVLSPAKNSPSPTTAKKKTNLTHQSVFYPSGLSGVFMRTEGLSWPSGITERNWVTFWYSDLPWVTAGLIQSSKPFDPLKVCKTFLFRQAVNPLTARMKPNNQGWCVGWGVYFRSFLRDHSHRSQPSAWNPASLQVGPSCVLHMICYLILGGMHKLK